jgi:hypothetical protein
MKEIIYTSAFAMVCYSSVCQTQKTVTFKPDAINGQDASIPSLYPDVNVSNHLHFWLEAWTWNGVPGLYTRNKRQ